MIPTSTTLIPLAAGPVHALFEPATGFLRTLRFGPHEIVRGVYAAVRDRNWGTVGPVIHDLKTNIQPDRFALSFTAVCKADGIDFRWQGTLAGDADGAVRYHFNGQALSDFQRNRIGFCVLHPGACAGSPCQVRHTDGHETAGAFPQYIAPQQPFQNIRSITHQAVPGTAVRVDMIGDTFEMEDQRNWTDASFKTYCTPLGNPFPVQVHRGDTVQQEIIIQPAPSVSVTPTPTLSNAQSPPIHVRVAPRAAVPMLALGLELTPDHEHSPAQLQALRQLSPAHLRVDLDLSGAAWRHRPGVPCPRSLLQLLSGVREPAVPQGAGPVHLDGHRHAYPRRDAFPFR